MAYKATITIVFESIDEAKDRELRRMDSTLRNRVEESNPMWEVIFDKSDLFGKEEDGSDASFHFVNPGDSVDDNDDIFMNRILKLLEAGKREEAMQLFSRK